MPVDSVDEVEGMVKPVCSVLASPRRRIVPNV